MSAGGSRNTGMTLNTRMLPDKPESFIQSEAERRLDRPSLHTHPLVRSTKPGYARSRRGPVPGSSGGATVLGGRGIL